MKTKITLTIGDVVHKLAADCLKNWGDVVCSYKRSGIDGIVRSFTSEFQFVGRAYYLLMDAYMAEGLRATATLSLYVLGDDWSWNKEFGAPLDFSSVKWDGRTFSINSVDNGVTSVIKAHKGTKYEFIVGQDLKSAGTFNFDRLTLKENVEYQLTLGENDEDDGSIWATHKISSDTDRLWLGCVASETMAGSALKWNDDQERTADGHCVESNVDGLSVGMEFAIDYSRLGVGPRTTVRASVIHPDGSASEPVTLFVFSEYNEVIEGFYTSVDQLPNPPKIVDTSLRAKSWRRFCANVNGFMYYFTGTEWGEGQWLSTGMTVGEFQHKTMDVTHTFTLNKGDRIAVLVDNADHGEYVGVRVYSSSLRFRWQSRGASCGIDAVSPQVLLRGLLNRMCDNYNMICSISGYDHRLANTLLLGAESVRGIDGGKIYTTFNDFCGWMETVFGYTYYINDTPDITFDPTNIIPCGWTVYTSVMQDYGVEVPEGDYSADEVKYNSALGRFVRDSVNGVLFHWPGDERWNDPATGLAHTDRLYHRSHPTWGDAYFTLEMNPDGTLNPEPVEYDIAPEKAGRPLKQVIFAHRSELFDPDGPLLVVEDAVDPEFSIDASIIYSTVEIGYAQEKSDNVNGREEFNGTHVYTTGITVTDHTLTLKSKYRADTYGIEFAAQKRGEDTTDSEVDEDVFFVLCQEISGAFYPDRSTDIVGTISPDAFNADFSPLACVEANKGYIGMMSQSVVLRFASSTGNSDVTIGGTPMTDDIHISSPLMTAGLVSFSTMSASSIKSAGMIGVESGGMRYVGFLKEIEEPYARGSQKDCTIFVKTIEKC